MPPSPTHGVTVARVAESHTGHIQENQNRTPSALGFGLYVIAYAVGYHYAQAFSHESGSPFWFPDSILLCALLVTRPTWWWLLIGSTLPIRLVTSVPPHVPAWFLTTTWAIGSAKGVTIALLLRAVKGDFRGIHTVREFVFYSLFAVLLMPTLGAFLGAAARAELGYAYWPAWEQWFLGNAVAQLVLTPILLHWFLRRHWQLPRSVPLQRWGEAALVATGMIVTAFIAFGGQNTSLSISDWRFYAPIPFMFWSAIRFGMRGATGSMAVLTVFAIAAALHGQPPFGGDTPERTAVAIQQFLALRAAPLYLVAVLSEQKDGIAASLRESNRRFRTMADTAPVMIWIAGTDMLCDFFNQSWLDFTGRTLEQERGSGWVDGVHPDDFTASNEHQTAFAARQPFTMEYRLRRHDGEYRWVLDHGVPRYTAEGDFAGFIGSAIDISDRYRQELALRESEERYREVVECQTDLVCRYLPDTTLTFINDAYCRFFRRDRKDLLGKSFLPLIPEKAQAALRDEIALVVRDRARRDVEHEVILADGRLGWQRWTNYPVLGAVGVEEIQGIGHDITDRKRLEETQRELAHASRLAIVGELTAIVAHELRQPLTAIMSNAEAARSFLRRPNPPLDEVREILADICASDQRASEAIVRLRALVNRRDIQFQPVDINEMVSIVLRLADGDAKRRRIRVRAELAPDVPHVFADAVHIQQVLLNLVINGLDATERAPESHRELVARTRSRGEEGVEVEVADHGSGIPVEKLPHVFHAFFSTKQDGMGIGLAIARSIIEVHGGSIWAENDPGGGAVFRFLLPTTPPTRPVASPPPMWSMADDAARVSSPAGSPEMASALPAF